VWPYVLDNIFEHYSKCIYNISVKHPYSIFGAYINHTKCIMSNTEYYLPYCSIEQFYCSVKIKLCKKKRDHGYSFTIVEISLHQYYLIALFPDDKNCTSIYSVLLFLPEIFQKLREFFRSHLRWKDFITV